MPHFRRSISALLLFLTAVLPAASQNTLNSLQPEAQKAFTAWKTAGSPSSTSPAAERLYSATVAGRPDLLEAVLTRGSVLKKMLRVPSGNDKTESIPLQTIRTFGDIHARFDEEMFSSFQGSGGWLARRITADRIEIWTATHGRLFNGKGRLLHEARPPRRTGTGREWYGAFLPDGRWVTTDLDDSDGTLAFFSVAGKPVRYQTMQQLAPGHTDYGWPLLGWARSDKTGAAWIVNVGSEEGIATVRITPDGPPRTLQGFERWQSCYPRALGPRGTCWFMSVPNDAADSQLNRSSAGHGPRVGYPDYTCESPMLGIKSPTGERVFTSSIVPNGNEIFGFWPARNSYFVGSEGNNNEYFEELREKDPHLKSFEPSGLRTRKFRDYGTDGEKIPVIDKTWFFDERGHMTAWIRARRLADAANGRSMLFRLTADSRIVTLTADLKVRAVRRFTWKDGTTADALTLWDDLHMGLFIRSHRLYLAHW